jgi:PKD repeat protein
MNKTKWLRLLILLIISWTCSLEKIDPSVKYDPCLNAVTSKFTHDKVGVVCDSPCIVKFINQSVGAKNYRWEFGDGGTSTEMNPTYIFKKAGKWEVKLTALNENNCNGVSMESVTIKTVAADVPVPDFTFSFSNSNAFAPVSVIFSNSSQNAISYRWSFGDNTGTSTEISPTYKFNVADAFTVKLEATNGAGVTKSITKVVTIKTRTFIKTQGQSGNDIGRYIRQTKDNGYILCGTANFYDIGSDIYISKINIDSSLAWEQNFKNSSFGANSNIGFSNGYSVIERTNGEYTLVGSISSGQFDKIGIYLGFFDFEGRVINEVILGKTGDVALFAQGTSDGGLIICGKTTNNTIGQSDVYLIKTNGLGVLSWSKNFGGLTYEEGASVQQTIDGGYIIAGATNSKGAGGYDVYLIKTNASGNLMWDKTFGGLTYDAAKSVQQTTDGGYIITGTTNSKGAGENDVYIIKTNANGSLLWEKTFGGTKDDQGNAVYQAMDGSYIICGSTNSKGVGDYDVYLIKIDSNGNLLWDKTFGGVSYDFGYSVQQTIDGGFIVCGSTNKGNGGFGNLDVYIIKTDKNGNVQ